MDLTRALRVAGRVLLTAGVLTLLFVAYQLWGTGIHEARAQGALADELEEVLAEADTAGASESAEAGEGDPAGTVPPPAPPDEGGAIARIGIPALGVDKVVVEGVRVDDLKRGPGHFPSTPLPGQEGNSAIAGHRTTYGAPFHRLDELVEDDEILVTTAQGEFRYLVREQQIVGPDAVEVLEDHGDDRLTLVACHPKYSAAQRIVVVAELDGTALPPSPRPDGAGEGSGTGSGADDENASEPDGAALDAGAGLSGDRAPALPAVLLGLTCALIWLAAWAAARLTTPWLAYAVGTPVFLVALFFFFESTSRFLPANI